MNTCERCVFMKKVLCMIAVAVVAFAFAYFIIGSEKTVNDASSGKIDLPVAKESSYVILIEDDDVVLYRTEKDEKILIKRERHMPARESDRALILKGVRVESLEEALMIFEDFIS